MHILQARWRCYQLNYLPEDKSLIAPPNCDPYPPDSNIWSSETPTLPNASCQHLNFLGNISACYWQKKTWCPSNQLDSYKLQCLTISRKKVFFKIREKFILEFHIKKKCIENSWKILVFRFRSKICYILSGAMDGCRFLSIHKHWISYE